MGAGVWCMVRVFWWVSCLCVYIPILGCLQRETFEILARAIYRLRKAPKLGQEARKVELEALESEHEAYCCVD